MKRTSGFWYLYGGNRHFGRHVVIAMVVAANSTLIRRSGLKLPPWSRIARPDSRLDSLQFKWHAAMASSTVVKSLGQPKHYVSA